MILLLEAVILEDLLRCLRVLAAGGLRRLIKYWKNKPDAYSSVQQGRRGSVDSLAPLVIVSCVFG